MKNSELHRIIRQHGWIALQDKGKGSHIIYAKDGKLYPVPYHGSREINNGFAKKILKELGIVWKQ